MADPAESTRGSGQAQDPEDADRLAEAHGETDFAGFPDPDEDPVTEARSATDDAPVEASDPEP